MKLVKVFSRAGDEDLHPQEVGSQTIHLFFQFVNVFATTIESFIWSFMTKSDV